MASLNPEYLEQYKNIIAADLAKDLRSQGSFRGRMSGELRVSENNRQKVADRLLKGHLAASEQFVMNKISGEFLKQELTNTQMADRLNEFSKASGIKQVYSASKIPSDRDLAQMRKTKSKSI